MGRLPPVSPPSPEGAERSGAPRRAQPGGVEGGERGDTIDSAADGDVMDWTRARGPVCAREEATAVRVDQANGLPRPAACVPSCKPRAAPPTVGQPRATHLHHV